MALESGIRQLQLPPGRRTGASVPATHPRAVVDTPSVNTEPVSPVAPTASGGLPHRDHGQAIAYRPELRGVAMTCLESAVIDPGKANSYYLNVGSGAVSVQLVNPPAVPESQRLGGAVRRRTWGATVTVHAVGGTVVWPASIAWTTRDGAAPACSGNTSGWYRFRVTFVEAAGTWVGSAADADADEEAEPAKPATEELAYKGFTYNWPLYSSSKSANYALLSKTANLAGQVMLVSEDGVTFEQHTINTDSAKRSQPVLRGIGLGPIVRLTGTEQEIFVASTWYNECNAPDGISNNWDYSPQLLVWSHDLKTWHYLSGLPLVKVRALAWDPTNSRIVALGTRPSNETDFTGNYMLISVKVSFSSISSKRYPRPRLSGLDMIQAPSGLATFAEGGNVQLFATAGAIAVRINGAATLYRTGNNGASWSAVSHPLQTLYDAAQHGARLMIRGTLWSASAQVNVAAFAVSTDCGGSWTICSGTLPAPLWSLSIQGRTVDAINGTDAQGNQTIYTYQLVAQQHTITPIALWSTPSGFACLYDASAVDNNRLYGYRDGQLEYLTWQHRLQQGVQVRQAWVDAGYNGARYSSVTDDSLLYPTRSSQAQLAISADGSSWSAVAWDGLGAEAQYAYQIPGQHRLCAGLSDGFALLWDRQIGSNTITDDRTVYSVVVDGGNLRASTSVAVLPQSKLPQAGQIIDGGHSSGHSPVYSTSATRTDV